jgi:hypothetical protein
MKTTIAINLGHKGFQTIEAEKVDIHGIPCAVHRSINKPGWSVSSVEYGVALISKAQSKALAIESALGAVAGNGADNVKAQLAKLPRVPSVVLESYKAPVKTPATKADIPAIVQAIHNTVPLTEREKAAVVRALNSRTGQLKSRAPSAFGDADERLAAAAWQGLQPNAFKVGLVSCFAIGHHEESRSLWTRLSAVRWPAALDKDKLALVNAGVW